MKEYTKKREENLDTATQQQQISDNVMDPVLCLEVGEKITLFRCIAKSMMFYDEMKAVVSGYDT